MDNDNDRTRYELQAEAEELADVIRRLDAVRGIVRESWSGDASKTFLGRLDNVIAEAEDAKKTIDRAADNIG
ncbi:MAG: WXG100 family type VII secretion target [Eubacterium sp.]|nr:WXG100 family type VII secretion target [Eubacterium sp.]